MPLLKFKKPLLYLVVLGSVFGSGMFFQAKRNAEKVAELERQRTEALVAQEREIRQEYAQVLSRESAARVILQDDLAALRLRQQILLEQVEGVTSGEGTGGDVFSSDFVRLWNQAGSTTDVGADTEAETR